MSTSTAVRPKVLVTCAQMQRTLPFLQGQIDDARLEVVVPELTSQHFSEDELISLLPGMTAIIAGDDTISRRVLESTDDLKILIKWGIGMDAIDAAAAEDRGVIVRNTPGVFGAEVAESAFAYMLLLARSHLQIDRAVRQGGWPKVEGRTLSGSTLGVIGLGSIGREVAVRGNAFGMTVVAFDPYISPESVDDVALDELAAVLAMSDFVVVTCPLTSQTRHLLDERAFAVIKPNCLIVNVSRGPVIEEEALVAALKSGQVAGAGLDVFEVEPLPPDSALRTMDNVILGAHNGSNTTEGVRRASVRALEILLEELQRTLAVTN